jgi:hypothetical protein
MRNLSFVGKINLTIGITFMMISFILLFNIIIVESSKGFALTFAGLGLSLVFLAYLYKKK